MTRVAARAVCRPRRRRSPALHVVQLSRDTALLDRAAGSEPVERQLGYARVLNEHAPGSRVTILVQAPPARTEAWTHEGLRVMPVARSIQGGFRYLRLLEALHREMPIAVLTTQVPYDEGWLALVMGAWHRIPVIGQIHTDLFAEHPEARFRRGRDLFRRWVTRHTLGRFAALRTVSGEARSAIARFASGVPLATIPVPVEMVASSATVAPRTKEPLVLFVGRLAPEKDLRTWLQVARLVGARHPGARFQIVGEGIERERLVREAEALGVAGAVSFAGFVPHDELRDLYASASVLLLTSREEGFGRVLVEAASQGTAAVSTALAGPRDIITNGVTGFLHEPGDVAALAHSVSLLVGQPQRAALMGAQAQRLALVRFDPERIRDAWVKLWIATAGGGERR